MKKTCWLCKKTTLKSHTTKYQLWSTHTLFSRLSVIAKSDRNLDLKAAISQHEFNSVNHTLLKADDTLNPCKAKSYLIKALNELPQTEPTPNELACTTDKKYLIIDGMAAVQALMHAIKF